MAAIERRTLKKAPSVDVVDAFTQPAPDPAPSTSPATSAPAPTDAAVSQGRSQDGTSAQQAPPVADAQRRGPGRPRSKRRMEPFSSKLDIQLRDSIDAYLFEHGGTLVDLLDEALRARIAK